MIPLFDRLFFGKNRPFHEWIIYATTTAGAVALIVFFGNQLLMSKYGDLARDAACSASKAMPENEFSRLLSTFCRAAKDGKITEDEARTILGRTQQVLGSGGVYFDNDRRNTDLRTLDEVDFAIERWKLANPAPKRDDSLRQKLPTLSETQLCVLSQAERYTDGDAIGIRYVGMGVCEAE